MSDVKCGLPSLYFTQLEEIFYKMQKIKMKPI